MVELNARADSTTRSYTRSMTRFANFCDKRGAAVLPLVADTACDFLLHLCETPCQGGRAFNPRSLHPIVCAFGWLASLVRCPDAADLMSRLRAFETGARCSFRAEDCSRRPLALPEFFAVVRAALAEERVDNRPVTALWAIALGTGLRVGALCRLRLRDIVPFSKGVGFAISHDRDKNRRELRRYDDAYLDGNHGGVHARLCRLIQEGLRARRAAGAAPDDPLALSPRGAPLGARSLNTILRRCLLAAGIDPALISNHSFRKTMATMLVGAGVPVPDIMRTGSWKSQTAMLGYVKPHGAVTAASSAALLTAAERRGRLARELALLASRPRDPVGLR